MEEDVAHESKVSDSESQVAIMLIKVESDFESNLKIFEICRPLLWSSQSGATGGNAGQSSRKHSKIRLFKSFTRKFRDYRSRKKVRLQHFRSYDFIKGLKMSRAKRMNDFVHLSDMTLTSSNLL